MMAHHTSVPVEPLLTEDSSNKEYTLYVNNLPDELNKDGIAEIFNYYGNVTGLFYRRNTNWAYVTYAKYNEAESAIRDLHDVPPLRLKVSFARENKSTKPQCINESIPQTVTTEVKNQNTKNVTSVNTLQTSGVGRGKALDTIQKTLSTSKFPSQGHTSNDDLTSTYPSDLRTHSPFETADPFNSTNTLWTRGNVTITEDGKRHVLLGRGYTSYEIPEPYIEVEEHINKVHEKRCVGLYEYGKDEVQHMIGKCQKCMKITQYTCKRCAAFYCSRNCQVEDWPRHKTECQNIPELIPAVNTMSLSASKSVEQTPVQNASGAQLPLRRPKKFGNAETSVDQDDNRPKEDKSVDPFGPMNTNITKLRQPNTKTVQRSNSTPPRQTEHKADVSQTQRSESQNSRIHSLNKTSCNTVNDNSSEKEARSKVKNSSDTGKFNAPKNLATTTQSFCGQDVTKIEEDISFQKPEFLSITKYTNVRIVEISNNTEYWVQKIDDTNALEDLMIRLQTADQSRHKVKPVVNNIYAAKYEGMWHRIFVLSTDPLLVNYIDYGNSEVLTTDDIREIGEFKSIPRFAHKIRLSEKASEVYKNLKYEDELFVKMVSVDSNNVINVEVKGEDGLHPSQTNSNDTPAVSNEPTTNGSPMKLTPSKSASKLQSVTSTVSVGAEGFIDVHSDLNNNTYNITLLPNHLASEFSSLLNEFQLMCIEKEGSSPSFKPNVGDLVCGKRSNGDWYRGVIVSLGPPMKMAVIDEAIVMPISKSLLLPEPFSNICAFGAQCKLMDNKCKLQESDQCLFKAIGCKTDKGQPEITIEIMKDSNKLIAVVVPWVPPTEQKEIQFAELKSGSEICLTAYKSHICLYVRPLNTVEEEYFNHVMQSVAKCAQTAPFLTKPPAIGEIVIGHFVDGNYYRAIVTDIKDDNVAISYVDFGNSEIVNINAKKLKVLSDDLKQLRSCTSKVNLKDVPQDVPMTKEISDYLNYLVGKEIHLICKFDGIPSQDGVHLSLRSGESVNDKIKEMLVPSWKKPDEDKECFMEHDITIVTLGKTGDVMEAFILHSIKDGHKYALCPVDTDLMRHIFNTMSTQMNTYCETTDYYIPRNKELCLARYEEQWYRALCVCRKETDDTSTIFFLDFGNIESVNHSEIRLMPKEFMKPDALATICTVVNLAPTDEKGEYSPQVQKRISELIVVNSRIEIKIINANVNTAEYDIELPNIRAQLTKEGLLS